MKTSQSINSNKTNMHSKTKE